MNKHLEMLEGKVAELLKIMQKLQKERDEIKAQLSETVEKVQRLEYDFSNAEKAKEDLKKRLEKVIEKIDALEMEMHNYVG